MSVENNLEDCIWGRLDWITYAKDLVAAERLDEDVLMEKIETVKGNIGRQIRKAVSSVKNIVQDL